MGGVTFTASLQDEAMRAALGRVQGLMTSPTPMLKQIGAGVVAAVQEHFERQSDPWGKAWHALCPAYAPLKKNSRILTESHHLVDSINYQLGARSVSVGSNVVYARIHQLGGKIVPKTRPALSFLLAVGKGNKPGIVQVKSVRIPARPYLGLGEAEKEAIALAVKLHMKRALGG